MIPRSIGIYGCLLTMVGLAGCDGAADSTNTHHDPQALASFIQGVKSRLVYVEGGEFLMGDFGPQYGQERLPYGRADTEPLHPVKLTSYSITKFKISNEEYQFYLTYNQLPGRYIENSMLRERWDERNNVPNGPAHLDWYEAEAYCQWLAKVTTLPFALPTEAQWEYAARSRGQFVIAPTNNGIIQIDGRKGINVTTEDDRKAYAKQVGNHLGIRSSMPGESRPPNPLGIYDMSGNGWEWVQDWYDPNYYQYSPVNDPQGPDKPVFKTLSGYDAKVMRAEDDAGPGRGLTITRFYADPKNRVSDEYLEPTDKTARCVVNSASPVQ